MLPDTLNLTLYRGLALPAFTVTILNGSSEESPALDLTGYTAAASVKLNYSDATTIFDIDVEITDAENGVIQVTFTQAMTTLLTVGTTYKWDFLLKPPGEEAYMIFKGKITVLGVVTPVP